MNSEEAADDKKSAASFLHEPWKEHAHKPLEDRKKVLDELIGHFQHNSDPLSERVIEKWRKGLGLDKS